MKRYVIITILAALLIPSISFAQSETWVAGAPSTWVMNKTQPLGFRINMAFRYESENSALSREDWNGTSSSFSVVKDLTYKKSTSILDLGGEFGFKGFSLFFNLPIILSSQATYGFRSGSTYPGYSEYNQCLLNHVGEESKCDPSGVNARNSTTVNDGISDGLGFSDNPLDGQAGERTLFTGKKRSGLDQLHLGLKINIPIFNQIEDRSKPFWIFVIDLGLPVGDIMDFKRTGDGSPVCSSGAPCSDPAVQRPVLNSAVGRGVYDVTLSSVMSKFIGRFDSFFRLYATLPFAYSPDSFYGKDYNFSDNWGMKSMKAPIKGGFEFGTDINVYKNPASKIAVNLFGRGAIRGVFEGQDYSEGYELFAGSPALNIHSATESYDILNTDAVLMNRLRYFPGITTVENYLVFEAQLGVRARITEWAIFEFGYGLRHNTEHFITYSDRGVDGKAGANPTPGQIDLGTREINPYYRSTIDSTGNRYRIQETLIHSFLISVKVMY